MPEWPDLHVVRGRLERALVGREIVLVRIGDPLVLRSRVDVERALAHRVFRAVRHRGKFLFFDLDQGMIVVNPMLAGVFELADAEAKLTRTTALSLVLDDAGAGTPGRGATDLRYRDDKRMGKVHVLGPGEDLAHVHGLAELGPDAGALRWNASEFAARARATRRELRNLLMDQSFVAGIGNAYADEILWEAQLHPKRRVSTLSDEELGRLYEALRSVLARGVREVEAGLPPELGTKIRDHMKVRGHKGKPCPRCGTPIVRTRHGLDDMYLCPRCQPPPRGQIR
jgi:formamidopyrimidine-DNA glycosylase